MISDNYKQEMLKEARQLDRLLGQGSDFEKLVHEITDQQMDLAVLELIKKLGVLTKNQILEDMEQRQDRMIKILFKYLGAFKVDGLFQSLKETSHQSIDDLLAQLDALVGLDNVKQQVHDLIAFHQMQLLRVQNGLKKSNKTLHMAFIGNPGTAKTTVARIVGRMYKSIGLLSKGHFIEASRTDLIAEYQGQTAVKVKRLIQRARGGVLFIDEAYSITENESSDSYGRECLTELTKALEDYRDDLVVIVAGYEHLMEHFFLSNPGLKSRFNTFIYFQDYSLEELVQIFHYLCRQNDYVADGQAVEEVRKLLQAKLEEGDEYFSNGRFVRNLFDDITMNQAKRLSKRTGQMTKEMLMCITKEDVS